MEKQDKTKIENNIFTEQTHPINSILWFFMSLGKTLLGIVNWAVDFVISMVISFVTFFKNIGIGAYNCVLGIIKFFKRKAHQFKYNDKYGRASYFVFGTSAFKNKQYTFGAFYVLFEVLYIILFSLFGIKSIGLLSSLGTVASFDDPDADFSQLVVGDNSIMILIYGLLWILSIAVFFYVWNKSINNGYTNFRVNNYLKFNEIYEKNLSFGQNLDNDALEAYNKGIKFTDFKESKKEIIEEHLNDIENQKIKDYTRYLLVNSARHVYLHLDEIKKENKKLDKINHKVTKITNYREEKLKLKLDNQKQKLVSKSDLEIENLKIKQAIEIEIFNNNTLSKVNNVKKKAIAQEHIIHELEKTYSFYIDKQHTSNSQRFGKNNDYYNHLEYLKNEQLFYNHYNEFVEIYKNGLANFENKNKENKVKSEEILVELNSKNEKTLAYYNKVREKKTVLEQKILEVKNTYKAEVDSIKANPQAGNETRLLEAKAKMAEKTTEVFRQISDLPTDKNIKALEKEELKESKRAYIRDKKYLKTDYKGSDLGMEEVVNKLVVEYKFNYSLAVKLSKLLFVKEGNNSVRFKDQNEIGNALSALSQNKDEYIMNHPDKYSVRFKSFVECVKSLFNEKFNITILMLPIIGIVLFTIVPLIFSIFVAFTNYSNGHQPPTQLFTWIGFENFKTIFAPDPNSTYAVLPSALSKTIGWTLLWAIVATFSNYILGIIVALMINKDGIKFKKLWRTIFITTIAVPQFISLLSIGTLLKDSGAIGTWYFETFGSRLGFGTDGSASAVMFAKFIIILVNIWVGIPYTILSTTGILLNIPKDLYESAKVDGASPVTQFTKITMPYILFVTGPYLITQFIGNINNFNVIFFLTGGGPALSGDGLLGLGQTDLLITFIYKIVTSTNNPQYGIASTVGIIVFIICSFISIVMYNKSGAIKEEDQFQ